MNGILPIDDLMSEVWSMYSGRDLKEFIEGKDYNSKTLNFVKSKLHDLKIEKKEKAIKWLSVGVGEGRDLQVLYAKRLRPINIDFYGIDVSDNLFETVEKSASALGIKQVHLEVVSAEDMDFKPKFDLISAILVLHEVDPTKLPLILKNMLRSLKKGGTLVISDFQKPYELEKNVVVWDDRDIKYLLKQISPKTGTSFEIMDSSESSEFGFYSCIIKKNGRISPRFFNRYKENITYFISTKIDNTQKDKEELTDQVKKRIEEITGEKEIDIDTLSKYEDQIKKKFAEEKYNAKLFKVMLLKNQLIYLYEIHRKLVEVGVAPPTPPKDPIQVYVESIKNNDFFRYITNPMVSRSIQLESLYVKLAISGIVHNPEHRFAMPDWATGKDYQLFTERRYLEKAKEEIDPEKAVKMWRRIVILGDPGSGKTTLLKYLTLEAANGRLKGELVPFFIPLGRYTRSKNKSDSLIEFACKEYGRRTSLDLEDFEEFVMRVKDLNNEDKALFLLDGFDEIPHDDLKQSVSDEIGMDLKRYVLSSRQVGYTGGVLNDKTLEVVELSDPAIREFIQNWMRSQKVPDQEKRAESLIDHIQIPRLKMLARNPLLLSIQCFVYQSMVESGTEVEMPTRRVELYKEYRTGLLKTLERRGITSQEIQRLNRRINVDRVFGDIAFHYFEEVEKAPRHIFEEEDLTECLRRISGKLDDHYADLLNDVVFQSEILHPLTMHEYHFLHLTFQEYYTAYHLANQADGIQTIVGKKRDPHWQEIIPLYAGMKSERFQELMDLIWGKGIDEDLFYNNLFLIGRCLAEVDLKRANIKSHDIEGIKNQLLELSLHGRFDMWRNGANEVLSHISYQFGDIEDKLIESLKDDESGVREAAAIALGKIESVKAVDSLILLLKEGDFGVGQFAAMALGCIGGEKVVELLIPLLKDDESGVREAAAIALGMIGGEKVVELLIPLLEDNDSDVRRNAVKALGMIRSEKAVELLIPLLEDNDSDDRRNAARALWFLRSEMAVKPLIPLLKDGDFDIRRSAAIALGIIGSEKAVEPLIPLLKVEEALPEDREFDVRRNAAIALGRIGSVKAVESLIPLLKDEEPPPVDVDDRRTDADALGSIGSEKALEPLIPLLKDEDPHVRWTVAEAFGEIGSEKALEPLIPLLKDEVSDVRREAAIALGRIGYGKALEPLIPLLNDKNVYVRRNAAEALGKIGSEKAVELLIPLLKDKFSDVRWAVAIALGKIGSEKAVELLIPLLNDGEMTFEYVYVDKEAAEALKHISEQNDLYIPMSKYTDL